MQAIIVSCNINNKNNKLFVNNGNFLDDYFGNSNIRIVNANDTKILYIFSAFNNNSVSDLSIISQCNRGIYIADIAYKTGFIALTNVFIAQFCNFSSLKVNKLYII